jgi:DNA polymerase-1
MIPFEAVTNKGKMTFNQVNIADATRYSAEDADYTLRVHRVLWPLLQEKPAPAKLFTELEIPLLSVLARMEYTGVLIDAEELAKQSATLGSRLDQLEAQIYGISGDPFNIDSPKQLQWVLYDKLHLPILAKTPTGQPSTAEPVLAELALSHALPALILEYRSLNKLKSTYTDKLPLQIKDESGRVHTSYQQAVTATGRLSSSDPNLQNIPVRSDIGRAIRKAFIAPKGYQIAALDYSQIELRIMAHLSNDKTLQDAFHHGLDIHAATASEVFGIPLNQVSSEQRRRAKAINFGLIYGMSAFGLAKQIGTSREEAQKHIDIYFNRYPGVKKYMDDSRAWAAKQGYVETLRGRRLYLPEIKSSNHMQRMAAERAAINAPLQGTAADIIKQAMLDVDSWLTKNKIDARMIMQVHDELVFEVATEHAPTIVKSLVDVMNKACLLTVPLLASSGIGANWDEAH